MVRKTIIQLACRNAFIAALGVLAFLSLFQAVLAEHATFGFRDAAHFYTPLNQYLQLRGQEQQLPLWSTLDSFGVPLAGETTTALYYPPRVLLSFCLNAPTAFSVYILTHLLWAGIGVFRLARRYTNNVILAYISAFSYTSSGPVFFLYTNTPFLVGAAWLPWIFLYLIKAHSRHCAVAPTHLIFASAAIAMCILGGDPQIAFHAVMVWCLWQVIVFCFAKGSRRLRHREPATLANDSDSGSPVANCGFQSWPLVKRGLRCLKIPAILLLATFLALPQIVSGISWAAQSHRAVTRPASIGDWLFSPSSHGASSNLEETRTTASKRRHSDQVLDFSIAPWHLVNLITPYSSGQLFPVNSRITKLLPYEPRMWTPTLYCGFLPGICFIATLARPRLSSAWYLLAIVSLAFALGQFGLYWLLYTFLPGYGQFRFPAKWLPLFALGLSVHSACLLSTIKPQSILSVSRLLQPTTVVCGLLLLFTLLPYTESWLTSFLRPYLTNAVDAQWGPFSIRGWLADIRATVLQTFLLLGGTLLLCRQLYRKRLTITWFWKILLVLCMIDAVLVARWQLAVVPAKSNASASKYSALNTGPEGSRFVLTKSNQPWPAHWKQFSDPERMLEVYEAEQATWVGRWHLPAQVAVLNNPLSLPSHRAVLFWNTVNSRVQQLPAEQQRSALNAVGAYLSVDAMARRVAGKLEFTKVPEPLPMVRLRTEWETVPPLAGESLADNLRKLVGIISQPDVAPKPIIEVHSPLAHRLESNEAVSLEVPPTDGPPTDGPQIASTLESTGDSVTVSVVTPVACCLQRMQLQDGGWRATLIEQTTGDSFAARVYPCDIISQAVIVPAGTWNVVFVYDPWWRLPANVLQALTLVLCLIVGVAARLRGREKGHPNLVTNAS